MLDFRGESHKLLVRIAIGIILIKLLLQRQSDLARPCLSRAFWQAASVQNFRTFTLGIYCLNCGQYLIMKSIGTASANSLECRGIRPRMYIEDLL